MTAWFIKGFLLCLLNVAAALFLSPLCEGIMRKLKAAIHSRIGPPVTQPYWDLLKLLAKRTSAAPAESSMQACRHSR